MHAENWSERVHEAFNKFAELKYNLLCARVGHVYFTIDNVGDSFGFRVGTRSSQTDKADTVRKRINTRMCTPTWGRIPLNQ